MNILVTPRSFGKTDSVVWQKLEMAGVNVIRNNSGSILNEQQLIEMIAECEGLIVGVETITDKVLNAGSKLRAIAKYGVGVDNIPIDLCHKKGVKVSKTIGANSDAVADYTFALMIAVARKLIQIDSMCRQSNWSKITSVDISGKTLGLIGLGAIGKKVAERARGFDMKIIAYDQFWDNDYAKDNNITRVSLDELLINADFISIHLPLVEETRHMIGRVQIEMMKTSAILINTARGGLVEETALLSALKQKKIYGAGIDVFENEPPLDNSWYSLDNVVLGSHTAASTIGATEKMGRMAVDNLLNDLALS